jgi:anti-sigma regulatory factor (Ser/Thr protein kinase)
MVDEAALVLQLTLRPVVAAPSIARHVVRGLAAVLDETVVETTELLVSELVTNSLRHGGSPQPIELRLQVNPAGTVRAEVVDLGEGFAGPPEGVRFPGQIATSGWGLYLVERIAHRWGVVEDGPTTVWFEVEPRTSGRGKLRRLHSTDGPSEFAFERSAGG